MLAVNFTFADCSSDVPSNGTTIQMLIFLQVFSWTEDRDYAKIPMTDSNEKNDNSYCNSTVMENKRKFVRG